MNKNKAEVTWQTPDMISVIHEMVEGMLDSAQTQLKNLHQAKDKPYVLDDATVERLLTLYTEQAAMLPIYQEQCQRWRKESLNQRQQAWLTEIETNLIPLIQHDAEILQLARAIAENTIEKVCQKDDVELGLDFLLGKKTQDTHKADSDEE